MHPLQCLLQVLMTLYVIVTFTPSLSIDLYKPEVFTPPPSPVARVAAEVEPREWLELVDKLINLRDTTNSNSCTSLALLPPTPEQSDHPPESQAINGTPPESQALSGILLVAFGIVLGRTGRPGPAGTRKLARTLHRRPRIPKRSDGTPSHRKVTPGSKAGIPLEVDCFATFRQPLQEHVVNQFAIPPTSTTIPAITSPESDQFLTCVTIEPCVLMLEPSRQLEPDAPVSLPSAVESSAVPETNGSITPATPKVEEKLDTANRSHTEDSTSLILPAECFISEAVSAEAVDLVVCRQDEPSQEVLAEDERLSHGIQQDDAGSAPSSLEYEPIPATPLVESFETAVEDPVESASTLDISPNSKAWIDGTIPENPSSEAVYFDGVPESIFNTTTSSIVPAANDLATPASPKAEQKMLDATDCVDTNFDLPNSLEREPIPATQLCKQCRAAIDDSAESSSTQDIFQPGPSNAGTDTKIQRFSGPTNKLNTSSTLVPGVAPSYLRSSKAPSAALLASEKHWEVVSKPVAAFPVNLKTFLEEVLTARCKESWMSGVLERLDNCLDQCRDRQSADTTQQIGVLDAVDKRISTRPDEIIALGELPEIPSKEALASVRPLWDKVQWMERNIILREQELMSDNFLEESLDHVNDTLAQLELLEQADAELRRLRQTQPRRRFVPPPMEEGHIPCVMLELRLGGKVSIDPAARVKAIEASLKRREKERAEKVDPMAQALHNAQPLKITGGVAGTERKLQERNSAAMGRVVAQP